MGRATLCALWLQTKSGFVSGHRFSHRDIFRITASFVSGRRFSYRGIALAMP